MTEEPNAWVSAQVPESLKQQVERIAEHDERSVSWVVRQALKNHVQNFGVPEDEKAAA
jgi:predicted transcriptional regulator